MVSSTEIFRQGIGILMIGQVHAESSTFAEGMSKKEVYAQVIEQARALFEDQRNWVRGQSSMNYETNK